MRHQKIQCDVHDGMRDLAALWFEALVAAMILIILMRM